jgi:iron complex outermembrane recepter protein
MTSTLLRPSRLAACALLLASVSLFAQTAASTPATPEVVELSPFQVTSQADRGYTVAESMTGSRVRTQIIDLPYTVNVMTSEFLEDFGLLELADNLTHISGFTGLDVGGNFFLRGFNAQYQLRDGFFRLGRYGSSNVDRIEIIKGSSAAIYGRTSPGGMINMISKQPKAENAQKLSFNYGDYGTERVTLEATGPLFQSKLGKTNYVLTASYYQRDFDMDYARNRNHEYYFAVDHAFADGSKLFLSAEHFAQERNSPLSAAPLVTDQKGTATTTDDIAIGYALNLAKYNPHGPNSELNRGNQSLTGVYDKNINSIFNFRLSGNYYKGRRWEYNQNNGWAGVAINSSTGAAPSSQRGATPQRGRIFQDGGGIQADLLAHYFTHNHQVEHRTLVTFDFNDFYNWNPNLSYVGAADITAWNAVRRVTLDANYNPVAPIAYFPKWYWEAQGETFTRYIKFHTRLLGGLFRQQSSFMGGRLLTYAGVRYDYVHHQHHDDITAASSFIPFIPTYKVGDIVEKSVTEMKPNLGVNYKLKDNLRVFANYSESFFMSQGDTPLDIANTSYKAEVADGWDYGFKGSFLDNRLTYTVSGFYINRENVTVQDLVESPAGSGVYIEQSRRDGNQLVRGYELDVNWNMTKELSTLFSYGSVHSIYTDFGAANPMAVGREVQFVSPYNGSVSFKYTPSRNALKGFSANVGVTFVGATPLESPNAGDTYTTSSTGARTLVRSTGQWALKSPAYNIWSLGVRYTTKYKANLSHTFAVNLNNIFDEYYLRPGSGGSNSRFLGEKRAVYFTYTLNHKGGAF